MKNICTIVFIIFLTMITSIQAQSQTETHRWKPLIINEKQRIWYDASQTDTVSGNKFNVWLLEMHKPPLEFSEIPDKIYRSMTLYSIDLNTAKYGILQVRYYNVTNKELYKFDYHNEDLPDNIKYTYPIMENSFMHKLIQKVFGNKTEESDN